MKDETFNQMDKTVRKYLKPDLVILDDMGLKQLPKHSGEYLLEVIMRRHENRSTIMTSNRVTYPLPGLSSIGSCFTPKSLRLRARVIASKRLPW